MFGALAGLRVVVHRARLRALLGRRRPGPRAARLAPDRAPLRAHRVACDAHGARCSARDAVRMREAYGLRADAAAAGGRRARLRRAGTMTARARSRRARARDRCRGLARGARLRRRVGRPARRARAAAVVARRPCLRARRLLLVVVPVAVRLSGAGMVRGLPDASHGCRRDRPVRRCALTAIALAPFALALRRGARRASYPGAAVPDVLSMRGVTYRYPGDERPALAGVDLALAEGELTVLAGVSGSGKSTLMRAACGLVPHFFGGEMAGSVVGLRARHARARARGRRRRGGDGVPGPRVAARDERRARGARALAGEPRPSAGRRGARGRGDSARVRDRGPARAAGAAPSPGGELQRVALAAALVARPRLLLLDEPTSQLDPVAGDELLSQLRRLNEEWGTTVLLGEHRLERCLAAADRVIALDRRDGRLRRFAAAPSSSGPRGTVRSSCRRPRACSRSPGSGPLPGDGQGSARTPAARACPRRALPTDAVEPRPRPRRRRPHRPFRLSDVWVEFDDGSGAGAVALRGLSLDVSRGETVALLGRNGAGKSTLLRAAAGVVAPDRGTVRADGEVALLLQTPVRLLPARAGRRRVARAMPRPRRCAELGLEDAAERDPRDLVGRRAPAAGAWHRARGTRHRRRRAAGGGRARRADARHGPGAEARARRAPRALAASGRRGARRDSRHRVRGARRAALRAARERARGGRRLDPRGPVGRALLHDRGRARARAPKGASCSPEEGASMLAPGLASPARDVVRA